MTLRPWYGAVALSVVFFLLPVALTACGNSAKPDFLSTEITGANLGKDFKLVDHTGRIRTLADFKGKAVVLFFGYTHCPDACPATMGNIAAALKKLGAEAQRVQVLFVTVDPERDTPELLAQYLSGFDPTILGLSGSVQEIRDLAGEFKVFYQKQAGDTPEHHTVDHSLGTFIYDTAGTLRLYLSNDKDGDVFAHDIAELLKTSG
ncbi:MAG: SCO family protein [Nitrosospira sp.]|nr:SCO family protein [Nitrosospira sp.]